MTTAAGANVSLSGGQVVAGTGITTTVTSPLVRQVAGQQVVNLQQLQLLGGSRSPQPQQQPGSGGSPKLQQQQQVAGGGKAMGLSGVKLVSAVKALQQQQQEPQTILIKQAATPQQQHVLHHQAKALAQLQQQQLKQQQQLQQQQQQLKQQQAIASVSGAVVSAAQQRLVTSVSVLGSGQPQAARVVTRVGGKLVPVAILAQQQQQQQQQQQPVVAKVFTNAQGQVISMESLLAHHKQHGTLPQGTALRVTTSTAASVKAQQQQVAAPTASLIQIPGAAAQFAVVSQGSLLSVPGSAASVTATSAATPRILQATQLQQQNAVVYGAYTGGLQKQQQQAAVKLVQTQGGAIASTAAATQLRVVGTAGATTAAGINLAHIGGKPIIIAAGKGQAAGQNVLLTTTQAGGGATQQQTVVLASWAQGGALVLQPSAVGAAQQILLPPGALNLKTLQGLKVIPLSQATAAAAAKGRQQVYARILSPGIRAQGATIATSAANIMVAAQQQQPRRVAVHGAGDSTGSGANPDHIVCNMNSVTAHINYLPSEILLHIFSYLPTSDLVVCVTKVCARWNTLPYGHKLWRRRHVELPEDEASVRALVKCFPKLPTVSMYLAIDTTPGRASIYDNYLSADIPTRDCFLSFLTTIIKNGDNITKLSVSGVNDGLEDVLKIIANLPNLQTLDLKGSCPANCSGIRLLADNCPHLKKVNIEEITFSEHEVEYFLRKKKNQLTHIGFPLEMAKRFSLLPFLAVCGDTLISLDIYGITGFRITPVRNLKVFKALKKLEHLSLHNAIRFVNGVLTKAFTSGWLSNLRTLALHNVTHVDDEVVAAICRHCPLLTDLAIHESEINGEGLKYLHCLQNLRTLDLSLSDYLQSLGTLSQCVQLQNLDLALCWLVRPREIADSVPRIRGLRRLDLTYCDASQLCLRELPHRLPFLHTISLWSAEVDEEQLETLKLCAPHIDVNGSIFKKNLFRELKLGTSTCDLTATLGVKKVN